MHESCKTPSLTTTLSAAQDQFGQSLFELSNRRPTLVLLLRHSGCTFCREALADLARQRSQIEAAGVQIAVVDMGDKPSGEQLVARHGLAGVSVFSDPGRTLYQALELSRGSLWQVIGPKVWWRGLKAAIFAGHGFGGITADVWQLAGAVLIDHGRVKRAFHHQTSADRPDYCEIAGAVH